MPPIVYANTSTRRFYGFLLGFLLLPFISQAQTIRYVSTTGTNTNPTNATTWASSTTSLQGAINASASGDQVWVAQGVYKPTISTGPDSRDVSFSMKPGVTIYGGFAGSGSPALIDRNPASFTTVLSGDIDNDGQLSGNSNHVIDNNFYYDYHVSPGSDKIGAFLDGFTITGGNANGPFGQLGGALQNQQSIITLRNCTIRDNFAVAGGAVSNTGNGNSGNGVITMINCSIRNNSASLNGGGITDGFYGVSYYYNCLISDNTARTGGGVYSGNYSTCTFVNCVIRNNSATEMGGGFHIGGSLGGPGGDFLTNCTLTGNSAPFGGAISGQDNGAATLSNTIAWNNGGQKAFQLLSLSGQGYVAFASHSLIESGANFSDNGHNLTATTSPFVSASNLQLNAGSAAIDQGNNQAYSSVSGPANDRAGNARIFNMVIDMGAYEYGSSPLPVRLVSFSASRYSDSSVGIEWKTSLETNSDYFEVQRSLDAHEFSALAQLKAQGNNTQQQHYQYTDNLPLSQTTYYRLRMVDRDGSVAYSKIVAVSPLADQALLRLVENPVSSGSVVRVWLRGYQPSQIHLYRLTGQAVEMHTVAQGDGSIMLVTGECLAPGHYVISVGNGTHRQSLRFVIN